MYELFKPLNDEIRLLMETELKPVQGERFQPTGFADLGAAVYQLPDGRRKLLVESVQSVANRLEQTIIGPDNELLSEFEGLPYIRVDLTGDTDAFTNSLIEAHRINSPFIISNDEFRTNFVEMAQYQKGKPLNWKKIARALFYYDINSLLHGVFLANLEDGRVKIPRAISGFIEADDIREAVSGGVKNNPIDPTGKIRAEGFDKDVYGNVPFHRVEYTAAQIKVYFNIDLGILRSYELGEEAYDLLLSLALYKASKFMKGGLRLRTACDLESGDLVCTSPPGFKVPEPVELLKIVKSRIVSCREKGMFADPPVTEIKTRVVKKADNSQAQTADNAEGQE